MNDMNILDNVAVPKPSVSRMDHSHDHATSFNMGELVPGTCIEALPGDVFEMSAENLLRFAPLISPVMHRVYVDTHFYFVPNRILWKNWNDFITGEGEHEWPYVVSQVGQPPVGSVGNYLGYPVPGLAGIKMSALPLAAYLRIWNDYYRDQDLQPDLFEGNLTLDDGDNTDFQFAGIGSSSAFEYLVDIPLRRNWMRDYFTSARPWAQKGDDVQIPLSTSPLPVSLDLTNTPFQKIVDTSGVAPVGSTDVVTFGGLGALGYNQSGFVTQALLDPNGTLKVDVQENAALMTDLWRAWALQRHLGMLGLTGTRINEWLLAVFGVRSSDARLQKPEYFGGLRQRMTISEVLATATTVNAEGEAIVPQGNMAGHGISYGSGKRFTYRCEEHGWIIAMVSVMPVTSYSQGLHRSLFRQDRFDYFTPGFEHIGQQAVLKKEIYTNSDSGLPDLEQTFGYVDRYLEYKFANNRVSGEMQNSLIYWNLSRQFSTMPSLTSSFVACGDLAADINALNRIFAVTDPTEDKIYAHLFYTVSIVRKMAKYSLPSGI